MATKTSSSTRRRSGTKCFTRLNLLVCDAHVCVSGNARTLINQSIDRLIASRTVVSRTSSLLRPAIARNMLEHLRRRLTNDGVSSYTAMMSILLSDWRPAWCQNNRTAGCLLVVVVLLLLRGKREPPMLPPSLSLSTVSSLSAAAEEELNCGILDRVSISAAERLVVWFTVARGGRLFAESERARERRVQ